MTPLRIGSEPVLLLDDHVVAETRGCRQTFHSAVKDPANPILTCTEPWEGKGPYTWGTRLLWNPDTGQYDFYYVGFRVEDNHYRWGLAVSPDGLAWEKPALNIETFDGMPARNMLTGGPHPEKAARSVVRDPRPDCPRAERYKAIRFTYDGELVSYSPDGRRWTEDPGNPVWYVPSDIIHAMWDPRRERFTTYYKIWEVTGETPDQAGGFRPITAHFPTFDHRPAGDGLAEISGPMVTFHPGGAATVENAALLLRAGEQGKDDGGGAPLTGAWHARRVQGWAESDDWRHWRGERVVLLQDGRDRPDANIQYMFVLPYGAYYLGFLTMHDERGHFEQQLAFSRDGLAWSRPWRGNFIGLGAPGAFDSSMVLAPTDPIVTDTHFVFYYGGFDLKHYEPMSRPWSSAIGRATLRRDGFASWESLPGETGALLTQPLTIGGETLCVNADAQDGRLRVEALDEVGQVIPGFSGELGEDTSRYAQCRKPIASVGQLAGKTVRLKFYLENARLFSFSFPRSQERDD